MNKSIFFSLIIIGSFLLSCNKKDNDVTTGNVLFYTNAQAMLNCGPFDVEIYINDSFEGIIEEPLTQEDENIDCSYSNSEIFLVLEKPEGNYEFKAKLTCSENSEYVGEFVVEKDCCSVIFIDLRNGE